MTPLERVIETMARGIHAEMTKDVRSYRPSFEGLGETVLMDLRRMARADLIEAGLVLRERP